MNSSTLYGDTGYAMLNVASGDLDPEGSNASSPLLNVHCRRALAHAIDKERYLEERGAGLPPADGPFAPGSLGYLEDTGDPEYDLDLAQSEMDTSVAELGTDTIEFAYSTTNDAFNVESNSLIISMWDEAFGDTVQAQITPIDQGQYIGLALVGQFNALRLAQPQSPTCRLGAVRRSRGDVRCSASPSTRRTSQVHPEFAELSAPLAVGLSENVTPITCRQSLPIASSTCR